MKAPMKRGSRDQRLSTEEGHMCCRSSLGIWCTAARSLGDNIHHLVLLHGCEEEGVFAHGVGGQQDALAAGEVVAGV